MKYWRVWDVNHNYITKWEKGEITKSVTKDLIKSMGFEEWETLSQEFFLLF